MIEEPVLPASCFRTEDAIIRGKVSAGEDCSFWFGSVVRSEEAEIRLHDRVNIQDRAVLHTDAGYDLELNDDVTVGHGAILHGCTVGSNSLIGMGAIVMNGAVIGKNCIVAAGSVVPEGRIYEDGMLILGTPARPVRYLREQEIENNRENAAEYVRLKETYRS